MSLLHYQPGPTHISSQKPWRETPADPVCPRCCDETLEATWSKEELSWFTASSPLFREARQGFRAGRAAGTTEEVHFLACFQAHVQFSVMCIPGLPAQKWYHP